MVLLPSCGCCATGTCVGLTYPDYFEFDLALAYDGSVSATIEQAVTRQEYGSTTSQWRAVTTQTPVQAPASVTVRANRLRNCGVFGDQWCNSYAYSGSGISISAGIDRSIVPTNSATVTLGVTFSAAMYEVSTKTKYTVPDEPEYTSCQPKTFYAGFGCQFICKSIALGSPAQIYEEAVNGRQFLLPGIAGLTVGGTNQGCSVIAHPYPKLYTECGNQAAKDVKVYVTDNVVFPMRVEQYLILSTEEFDTVSSSPGLSVTNKREITSSTSGRLQTPPWTDVGHSTRTFFNKRKLSFSILSMRYGYGIADAVDLIPSGVSKSSIGDGVNTDCVTNTPSLWLYDY